MNSKFVLMAMAFLFISTSAFAMVDHVIIVSIDGGKPSVIEKSKMPNLNLTIAEGSRAFTAKTILPSKTLPSHVSMLTGVSPSIHKVTWNDWIPSKGVVQVPTVFGLAKKEGLTTALFAAKDKFKHLEVKGTLDKFWIKETTAVNVANAASDYFKMNKPNLLFVHLPDADVAGHANGWGSQSQITAFANVDTAIGIIKKSIVETLGTSNYVLIVTADHGGTGKGHGSSSAADTTIPWVAWGETTNVGQIESSINTYDTAATALWLLNVPVPLNWEGKPVKTGFKIF